MTTQVQGATFRYTHTIGRGEEAGTGFKNPVAVALGADNVMYVISRAYDYRADSKRITVLSFHALVCNGSQTYLLLFLPLQAQRSHKETFCDGYLNYPSQI